MSSSRIYLGIHGNVFAVDRSTGEEIWCCELKGSEFVNLLVEGDVIFATSRGEAYAIDAASGTILWHNKLAGQGWGVVSIATDSGKSTPAPPVAADQKLKAQQSAVQASTT
jgi:outer membrane protein assembly factor BamB